MFTRTVHFEAMRRSEKVNYTCTRCSKKRVKTVTTEHTVNPFNKNPDGTVKNRMEVLECVRTAQAKSVAEVKAGEKCNKCKDEIVAEREAARKVAS